MKILVDGDSCPVKDIIIDIAKSYGISVRFFCSINHYMRDLKYGEVIYVDEYSQAVDIKIANELKKGDIVVTNDYGLAALAIGKGCLGISNRGQVFNRDNINQFLINRQITMDAKKRGARIKGPRKRHFQDDDHFRKALINLIENKE